MSAAVFSLDSWYFKIGVVALILGMHYLIKFRLRPRSAWGKSFRQNAHESLESLGIVLALLFFFIQPFVAQAFMIPTGSMENTLPIGDRILASPLAPRLLGVDAGQVLVFRAPKIALDLAGGDTSGPFWIKRCIGVAGDRIEIKNRVLYRNGKEVAEHYTNWGPNGFSYDMKIVGDAVYSREYDSVGTPGLWQQAQVAVSMSEQNSISNAAPGVVPRGSLLMLGDHRDASLDGHIWGFLRRDAIVGRAFGVIWPPGQFGTIEGK